MSDCVLLFIEQKYGYGIEYYKHYNGYEFWGHTGNHRGFRSMVFLHTRKRCQHSPSLQTSTGRTDGKYSISCLSI